MHKGVCQAAPFWSGQSSDKKSQGRGEASERKWQCKNGRMELADGSVGNGGMGQLCHRTQLRAEQCGSAPVPIRADIFAST